MTLEDAKNIIYKGIHDDRELSCLQLETIIKTKASIIRDLCNILCDLDKYEGVKLTKMFVNGIRLIKELNEEIKERQSNNVIYLNFSQSQKLNEEIKERQSNNVIYLNFSQSQI